MSNDAILVPDDEDVINDSDFPPTSDTAAPSVAGAQISVPCPLGLTKLCAQPVIFMLVLMLLLYLCMMIRLTWKRYLPEIAQLTSQSGDLPGCCCSERFRREERVPRSQR